MINPLNKNKMSKKIKFKFLNETFELPINSLRDDSYDGTKYIHMGAKNTASVIKQYVKKKYGNRIKVWSTSSVYSGGSSVRVNVAQKNGSAVPYEMFKDIQAFGNSFQGGYFDGMYDIYEYRTDELNTDNGTQFKYFPSYVFVDNKAPFGTLEYWLNEWKNFDESKWDTSGSKKFVGNNPLERFLNWNREYFNKGVEEKIVKYIDTITEETLALGYTKEELGIS